jgi:hypothetical protein
VKLDFQQRDGGVMGQALKELFSMYQWRCAAAIDKHGILCILQTGSDDFFS